MSSIDTRNDYTRGHEHGYSDGFGFGCMVGFAAALFFIGLTWLIWGIG